MNHFSELCSNDVQQPFIPLCLLRFSVNSNEHQLLPLCIEFFFLHEIKGDEEEIIKNNSLGNESLSFHVYVN